MKFGKVGILSLCLLGALALIIALISPMLFFGNNKPTTAQPSTTADQHWPLAAKGVVTSLRTTREGERFIRLSPHFYNTDAELRRVLELL